MEGFARDEFSGYFMTPEASVKKAVKAILAKYKIWYFMPSMSGFGRAGIPDFICCIRGRLLGIETKAQKGKLTRIQKIEHQAINDAGGVCIVMRFDWFPALEMLIHIMLRAPNIGTESASIPATEEAITEGLATAQAQRAEIEKNAQISARALSAEPNKNIQSEIPVGLQECAHGTPFAYACEECDKETCDHGKRFDEPCESCDIEDDARNAQ